MAISSASKPNLINLANISGADFASNSTMMFFKSNIDSFCRMNSNLLLYKKQRINEHALRKKKAPPQRHNKKDKERWTV